MEKGITRRDFARVLGIPFLLCSPNPSFSKNHKNIRLEQDWDAAIQENNLRNEVSDLMKKTNMSISYDAGFTSESIVRSNSSLPQLYRIRDDLKGHSHIPGGRGHIHYSKL